MTFPGKVFCCRSGPRQNFDNPRQERLARIRQAIYINIKYVTFLGALVCCYLPIHNWRLCYELNLTYTVRLKYRKKITRCALLNFRFIFFEIFFVARDTNILHIFSSDCYISCNFYYSYFSVSSMSFIFLNPMSNFFFRTISQRAPDLPQIRQ